MRELSKQEIEKISGGIAEMSLVFTQNHTPKTANEFQYSTLVPEITMPRFNLVEDYFSKKHPVS
jgi:hypothetical protein